MVPPGDGLTSSARAWPWLSARRMLAGHSFLEDAWGDAIDGVVDAFSNHLRLGASLFASHTKQPNNHWISAYTWNAMQTRLKLKQI